MTNEATVFLIDDDEMLRQHMVLLVEEAGYSVRSFPSAEDFLLVCSSDLRGCVVSDIRMKGMSGIALQAKMVEKEVTLPFILISAYADVKMAVEAMRKGAYDFLEKPLKDMEFLDKVAAAMAQDRTVAAQETEALATRTKLNNLTGREREVLDCLLQGMANKVIAMELGIAERTVEYHRARVMNKMSAESLAELVRMTVSVDRHGQSG